MGYRQVVIRKWYKLRTKDNQLVIEKEKEIKKVPLEDINYILLEDNTCTITGKLISELGNFGICLITCDDKHEPSTIMYPYNHHYKQLEVLEQQLVITEILKEKLWQEIIKAKIKNLVTPLVRSSIFSAKNDRSYQPVFPNPANPAKSEKHRLNGRLPCLLPRPERYIKRLEPCPRCARCTADRFFHQPFFLHCRGQRLQTKRR